MQALYEKYRPRSLDDVIGQDKAVRTLRALGRRGYGGRALWFTGKSGQGKTTLAKIIAAEMADTINTTETVGRALTPALLERMREAWHYYAMGERPGYALIVNEAHGLAKPAIEYLLNLLEEMAAGKFGNVVILFTTTTDGQAYFEDTQLDAGPFASRVITVNLAQTGLAQAFAEKAREIAEKEGLNGRPIEQYVRLAKDTRNNLRAMLQRVEAGEMMEC